MLCNLFDIHKFTLCHIYPFLDSLLTCRMRHNRRSPYPQYLFHCPSILFTPCPCPVHRRQGNTLSHLGRGRSALLFVPPSLSRPGTVNPFPIIPGWAVFKFLRILFMTFHTYPVVVRSGEALVTKKTTSRFKFYHSDPFLKKVAGWGKS